MTTSGVTKSVQDSFKRVNRELQERGPQVRFDRHPTRALTLSTRRPKPRRVARVQSPISFRRVKRSSASSLTFERALSQLDPRAPEVHRDLLDLDLSAMPSKHVRTPVKAFPTRELLFPALALDASDSQRFELLARAVVRNTLTEYDDFVEAQHRRVSKRRWKRVKSRENIAVYKERGHNPQRNVHRGIASGLLERAYTNAASTDEENTTGSLGAAALLAHFPAQEYNLPKLLMVGTITGSLDDVLYGLSTHDSSSILLRSIYTQDEIVDGQVVHQFEGPSREDPYRFLGIKWVMKGHQPAVSAVVAPRDALFLNSVGVISRHRSGVGDDEDATERIGYFMMHSVELPDAVPSLHRSHGVVRARVSSCHIFRQLHNGCVEVYMTGYVEPSGKVVESVALSSAVSGLLFCWKSVVCAQAKKIVRLLQHHEKHQQRPGSDASSSSSGSSAKSAADEDVDEDRPKIGRRSSSMSLACGLCERHLSVFKSSVKCALCDLEVCSRCRVSMKLCFETAGVKLVEQRNVVLCKCCITRAHRMDTFQVAQEEARCGVSTSLDGDGSGDNHRVMSPTDTCSTNVWGEDVRVETFGGEKARSSTTDTLDMLDLDVPVCEWNNLPDTPTASEEDTLSMRLSDSKTHGCMTPEALDLWTRMAQLKIQAEDVYHYTRNNANLIEWGNGALDLR